VKIVVSLGLLASFLLAPRLFLQHPFLTPIPVFSGVPALPPAVVLIVLLALGGLLLPILVLPRPWKLVLVWCVLFAARTVWDESTWQPYFYLYFFMFLLLTFAGRRQDDLEILDSHRLLLISMYWWSGLHKFNHDFFHLALSDIFPKLASSIPAGYVPWVGLLLAGGETALGIGLLFRRSRRIAMLGAIAMHAALLTGLGPWGQHYNRVVWPWNAALILLLIVLFHKHEGPVLRSNLSPRGRATRAIVLVFFVLGPLSSWAGVWPAYFSFKLYSRNIHSGTIFVTPPVVEALSPRAREKLVSAVVGPYTGYLLVLPWSEHELGALLPPEPAVFQEVARRLCTLATGPTDVLLVIEDPPDVWTGTTRKTARWCADLGAATTAPR
jgi:hypothetical protein